MISRPALGALAAAALASLSLANAAAPFTPGNVVVYRIGSGTGALSANGNPVFLDEFTPGGALVQSVPLPTAAAGANKALIASGTAASDGLLTRSADGQCLAVPGYSRNLGTGTGNLTSGTTDGSTPVPRAVARVGATATIDSTTVLTDFAVGSNPRGAATGDCNGFWVGGGAGGVRYATLGSSSSSDLTSSTFANVRAVQIHDGQLYASASVTDLRGVATVGTGLPTTGPQALAKLPGLTNTNSPGVYAFFFADLDGMPGPDTLYIADELAGGLTKFSRVAGTWVANGTVGGASGDAYRGITATVAGNVVTLFATRRTGSALTPGGQLVKLVDASGFNGAFGGEPTVLSTASANSVYRGVALTPEVTLTPSAGAHGSIAPATPQVVGGGMSRSFTITADAGYSAVVGGTCGGTLAGNTYTTAPATGNCTVEATFTLLPTATVTPSAGPNGSITPSTPQTLLQGARASFEVVAAPGYSTAVGGTCGGELAGTTFTTPPLTADCTVTAVFTLITFTVTSSAGPHGGITPSGSQAVPMGTRATFTLATERGYGASVGGTCGGTLAGNVFTTDPIHADCSVAASFAPLPRYLVTATSNANGSVTPATQEVIAGETATVTINGAPGYAAAVRGTCGGTLMGNAYTTSPVSRSCTVDVRFARKLVLFVGNSYTFGRIDPVMSYNTANVTDLTLEMWRANPLGSNEDEPHPWGGIPGVFKKMLDQAGLDWDVSISARNAASLRGHYLNSNPAGWDLRGNIASQRWDIVMLQELSDGALPAGRGANANLANFNTYVDRIEQYVHAGTADAGLPVNPHARADAQVFLYQTWARPDMIAPNGTNANGHFYTAAEGLEAMTADLHASYFDRAAANPRIEDVAPVGDAFLRAVQAGIAMRDPYVPEAGKVDLWYTDYFHPSKYGSYLSALVHFATLTGLNPLSLGATEQAAADLGIAPDVAVQLQRVAQATVSPDATAPASSAAMAPAPNAAGWHRGDVSIAFNATDEANGSGVDGIRYTLTGAETRSGSLGPGATLTIRTEGVTTLTWFAVDRAGNAEAARTLRIAIDRTPPVIAGMPVASCSIWPPNGRMVQVATVGASDALSGVATLLADGTSSEAGSGDIAVTGAGTAPRGVSLRATRAANGPGRVYTIVANAVDAAGNAATATSTCTVPHDQR